MADTSQNLRGKYVSITHRGLTNGEVIYGTVVKGYTYAYPEGQGVGLAISIDEEATSEGLFKSLTESFPKCEVWISNMDDPSVEVVVIDEPKVKELETKIEELKMEKSEKLLNTETFTLHAHNTNTHKDNGSATFVFSVDKETNQFTLSVSVCSKNDQFSRKCGRMRASYRLLSKGPKVIKGVLYDFLSMRESVMVALEVFLSEEEHKGNTGTQKFRLYSKARDALIGTL